jgi:acyl transferase domain-containing protein
LKSLKKSVPNQLPTAIIGMGCFFPKSSGLKEYWRLIAQAQDGITEVPHTHWSAEDYYHPDPKTPDHVYCKRGGFLSPVMFDPAEFGIPPNTLEATDSSQILGLIAAKMALTDAGYGGENGRKFNRDRTSVILGVTGTQELVIPLSSRLGFPKWRRALEAAGVPTETTEKVINGISKSYVGWQENSFPGLLGNVVAGKICNRLDIAGTNCVVDAACASSMSAIHLALMELSSDRSDMVITGGVDTLNDIFMHMCFSKTQTLSPTGDARPFSKNADGTVLGEGIGLLVLKRLADAQKDGDRIYAVIRALGSASDGKSQSIYSPSVEGQAKALQLAYKNSAVPPSTVELIEAHGTGTRVGDKVEFNALCQVFDKQSSNGQKCALGSVKSMIGHTKAAAGAAGLIKTALSLYHKILPPTLARV